MLVLSCTHHDGPTGFHRYELHAKADCQLTDPEHPLEGVRPLGLPLARISVSKIGDDWYKTFKIEAGGEVHEFHGQVVGLSLLHELEDWKVKRFSKPDTEASPIFKACERALEQLIAEESAEAECAPEYCKEAAAKYVLGLQNDLMEIRDPNRHVLLMRTAGIPALVNCYEVGED